MTKSVNNNVLDAALQFVIDNATQLYITTSANPTTLAMVTANAVVSINVSSADFTGPVDGDTSGRKITVGAKTSQPAEADANATAHTVAIVGTSGASSANHHVLYVTDVTATDVQVIVSGNTINTEAWDIELADPT